MNKMSTGEIVLFGVFLILFWLVPPFVALTLGNRFVALPPGTQESTSSVEVSLEEVPTLSAQLGKIEPGCTVQVTVSGVTARFGVLEHPESWSLEVNKRDFSKLLVVSGDRPLRPLVSELQRGFMMSHRGHFLMDITDSNLLAAVDSIECPEISGDVVVQFLRGEHGQSYSERKVRWGR